MILFVYLDKLPKIPNELLKKQEEEFARWHNSGIEKNYLQRSFLNRPEERFKYMLGPKPMQRKLVTGEIVDSINYERWDLTNELNSWIEEHICKGDNIGMQLSFPVIQGSHKHLPHTDSPPRRWVLNYMWETGGDNVRTQIYHERGQLLERQAMLAPNNFDNLELIRSFVIQPYRWYLLNTRVIHGVEGILDFRKTISMGLSDENPLKRIPSYYGTIDFPSQSDSSIL